MFDFQSLRNSVKSINEQHGNLCQQIAETRQTLSSVEHARAHRDDIKALLNNWVNISAEKFGPKVAAQVASGNYLNFTIFSDDSGKTDPAALNAFMCATFGQHIRHALSNAVDVMEWNAEGLPVAKRQSEIDRLKKQLEKLESERSEIEVKATEAGIRLE